MSVLVIVLASACLSSSLAIPTPDRVPCTEGSPLPYCQNYTLQDVKCSLKANVIVLLDSTVKPELFTMMKRSGLEAILAMDLSKSQVGVWQMTNPYQEELSLGPVTKEMLIDTFKDMKQAKADSLQPAAGKALTGAVSELQKLESSTSDRTPQAILYVAGSTSGPDALKAAEAARNSGVYVRGIAMGTDAAATQELIEMSGGQMNVFQLPAEDTQMTDGKASDLAEWFCKYATTN